METEAESVAYVVADLVGFDTSAYSVGDVAGWAEADVELIRGTAARVLATAHQIAAVLDPEDDDTVGTDEATPQRLTTVSCAPALFPMTGRPVLVAFANAMLWCQSRSLKTLPTGVPSARPDADMSTSAPRPSVPLGPCRSKAEAAQP
ncbi:hypothetical protein DEJ33_00235 [Curtobacterium sp. MCPF17_047]|uniref:hypothetical protein n=1 Tax=unclassified Curtobacterium TaxID=257496 RepID=UPI000DA9589F|nr:MULTISPECIES: hypothetical protein [unclassified Curtobacterium]PZE62919.1 hypothetical protein DEJ24_01220 [Curtobacterium sp. MCPF17_001]PZF68848.1 hypothetical protein DEJ33_00235 [Curtobacterium sp. MCPF17_047]